jgi:hypothetical protein
MRQPKTTLVTSQLRHPSHSNGLLRMDRPTEHPASKALQYCCILTYCWLRYYCVTMEFFFFKSPGCVVFVVVVREDCIVLVWGVDRFFFLEILIDCTALVVGKVISITKDTPNVTRVFLSRAVTRWVVISTFYTPRLEVANVFSMPTTLTVGILSDILRWYQQAVAFFFLFPNLFGNEHVPIVAHVGGFHKRNSENFLKLVLFRMGWRVVN